jgi:hypothetical protein
MKELGLDEVVVLVLTLLRWRVCCCFKGLVHARKHYGVGMVPIPWLFRKFGDAYEAVA